MSDLARPVHSGELRMTRSHLLAIALMGVAIGFLAFFLGLRVGRGESGGQAAPAAAAFTPDPDTELALEALFREVEAVSMATPPAVDGTEAATDDLVFPEALIHEGTPAVAANGEKVEAATQAGATPGYEPPKPAGAPEPPTSGWSIQVAAYPDASEADRQVAALASLGYLSYRSDALTDGKNLYRVRVGGFPSQVEAEQAKAKLAARLDGAALTLQAAP